MVNEPRDPALAAIFRGTVRVAGGSGVVVRNGRAAVVVTANHVVPGDGPYVVRGGPAVREQVVLARDATADVAVLGAPVELEKFALEIAPDHDGARVADPLWASGFPRGWAGNDPVLLRGVVAGIGAENWANLDGTWGNSGGPLCISVDGVPVVGGVVLGKAGDVSHELEDFRQSTATRLENTEIVRMLLRLVVDLDVDDDRPAKTDAFLRHAETRSDFFTTSQTLLRFLEDHFRTGFIRFADAAAIRKLL